ncbi:PLP-dependent transferase [Streptomyces canarius]
MSNWAFETRQVHAGAVPDPATGARAVPIHPATSYVFRDTAHAAAAFELADLTTHAYTRLSNPTTAVAEERIAALEGGTAAVAVASGQAATSLALLNLARAGDHIVASSSLYGGTRTLLEHTFADLGIDVTFVDDPDDLGAWYTAVRPTTKAFFGETLGNPRGNVLDIEAVAGIAHETGVPLVVDNTVLTPYLLRPFEHGADIVVHSTTKFLSGHGTGIGGAVVDSGRFDFRCRFRPLAGADPPGSDVQRAVVLGLLLRSRPRLRAAAANRLVRDLGPAVSPSPSCTAGSPACRATSPATVTTSRTSPWRRSEARVTLYVLRRAALLVV